MIVVQGIVRHFGELISKAEEQAIEGIVESRTETEPSITDRFLARIEAVFEEHGEKNGLRLRARTLRDRGPGAPERRFGADFCAVLDIRLRGYQQSKGFLAQAKRESESSGIDISRYRGQIKVGFPDNQEFRRLSKQTEKMLSVTPDSFVLVYSTRGFVVVPASSIRDLNSSGRLYGMPVDRFFKHFLMCFVGDRRLNAYDDQSLEKLAAEYALRNAVMFQISEGWGWLWAR